MINIIVNLPLWLIPTHNNSPKNIANSFLFKNENHKNYGLSKNNSNQIPAELLAKNIVNNLKERKTNLNSISNNTKNILALSHLKKIANFSTTEILNKNFLDLSKFNTDNYLNENIFPALKISDFNIKHNDIPRKIIKYSNFCNLKNNSPSLLQKIPAKVLNFKKSDYYSIIKPYSSNKANTSANNSSFKKVLSDSINNTNSLNSHNLKSNISISLGGNSSRTTASINSSSSSSSSTIKMECTSFTS